MAGTAYVWMDGEYEALEGIADPDMEIDGDAFWIWTDGEHALVSFESWEGQAKQAVEFLIPRNPVLAILPISEESHHGAGDLLGSLLRSTVPPIMEPSVVERWYHGTSSANLKAILEEGLRGDLPHDRRSWRVADIPLDTLYLAESRDIAASYADRAAAHTQGRPVVIVIDGSRLNKDAIVTDRDFPLLECAKIWMTGAMGDCSEAAASLTLTGKIGYAGSIPADVFFKVIERRGREWVDVETAEQAIAPLPGR